MGKQQARPQRCMWVLRSAARIEVAVKKLNAINHMITDPSTPRQAAILGILRIIISFLGIGFLAYCAYNAYLRSIEKEETPKNEFPTIVWATNEYYFKNPGETLKCLYEGKFLQCEIRNQHSEPPGGADAYVFYGTLIRYYPLPRDPKILWGLLHEESPRNNVKLMNEKGLNLFNFSATYSRYADVPCPLIYVGNIDYITDVTHFVDTKNKNARLGEFAPVLYMQTNCYSSTERDDYVQTLMRYIKVDSYGLCLHNKDLPLGLYFQPSVERNYLHHLDADELMEVVKWYKFVIAIENGVCNDYLTEKLWRALRTGVVPIYMGSAEVRDWLPHPMAAILLEDYPTPALMAARLHEINSNDTLYDLHLDHKINRRILNQRFIDEYYTRGYQRDFIAINIRLMCLMCERLYENSSRVNIVTKKHYDCPEPLSALTQTVNPDNHYKLMARLEEENVDALYKQIEKIRNSKNTTRFHFHNQDAEDSPVVVVSDDYDDDNDEE